jgi:uncharacterized cupredoxin-like copper-binding protein
VKRLAMLACLAILPLSVVACSSSDDDSSSSTATPGADMTATMPATSSGEGTTVQVTEKDFELSLDQIDLPAGKVTFEVSNEGPTTHEFVVIKTDLAADQLPQSDNVVTEDADGINVIDEVEDIAAGETKELSVDLEPGHYVVICNIATHYGLGMRSDISVEAPGS